MMELLPNVAIAFLVISSVGGVLALLVSLLSKPVDDAGLWVGIGNLLCAAGLFCWLKGQLPLGAVLIFAAGPCLYASGMGREGHQ
jgi:hypothetical protein